MLVATFLGMSVADSYLQTESAPYGIVSLELCAFYSSCNKILTQWDATKRQMAMFSLGLDYLFIFMYAASFLSVLAIVKRRLGHSAVSISNFAIVSVLVAALCDAIENVMLIKFLETQTISTYAVPAGYFAALKFTLLAAAATWALAGLIHSHRRKRDA